MIETHPKLNKCVLGSNRFSHKIGCVYLNHRCNGLNTIWLLYFGIAFKKRSVLLFSKLVKDCGKQRKFSLISCDNEKSAIQKYKLKKKKSTWYIVQVLGIFESSLFNYCILRTISLTIFFLQSLHVTVVLGHSELCCCILQKNIK